MTRTVLAVHAHPDDESITMGGTLARLLTAGDRVVLVTATLGEEGEIIGPDLAGLAADRADQLGGYRLAELTAACAALGGLARRQLVGTGRFRDSGMAGTPSATHPRAFLRAQRGGPDHAEAVAALASVIAEVDPDVLLTYDADGGYGHPDHIAAHQVCLAAGGASVPLVLAVVKPVGEYHAALTGLPVPSGYLPALDGDLGTLIADDLVDLRVDVAAHRADRRAALAAHATQLDLLPGGFALTNRIAQPLLDAEYLRVLAGDADPDDPVFRSWQAR